MANAATLPYANSCAVTDAVDSKMATPGGLKLGLTKAEVEKVEAEAAAEAPAEETAAAE